MPTIKFLPLSEYKNVCNVIVNGCESNWYVQKTGFGWYEIQWGKASDRLSFLKQSWFATQDPQELKEKLQACVNTPVEICEAERHGKYVYQGN